MSGKSALTEGQRLRSVRRDVFLSESEAISKDPFPSGSKVGASLMGNPWIIGRQNPLRCSKIAIVGLPYIHKIGNIL